ncbi:MAG: Na+/H+ antiporter subunit D [Rhodobacteraceae bacterium]|nr:MAG: Na+/H+ antiporter subunit D [Paracoccaceae bacterium]
MLLALPIAVPFLTGVVCLALRASPPFQRLASLIGAAASVIVASRIAEAVLAEGPFAEQMGGWPAPFGITLAADMLSAGLLLVTSICGVAVVLFGFSEVEETSELRGHHTLLHVMLGGVSGAFVTGDLFNLYVWFEVLLIASFGLLVVRGGRRQFDGAIRYVALNLTATIGFLTGVGLLYGATGALNMADLHRAVAEIDDPRKLYATGALLLFAFGAKAALFPVFFWLPASYHTPSFTVSAIFAALLTKVGVYAIFRTFTLIYPPDTPYLAEVLMAAGALTMVVGVFGALAEREVRRVLSFSVIASIGFMIVALSIGTEAAIAAGVFYLLQDMFLKVALFAVAWLAVRRGGSEDFRLSGGLWPVAPMLGALFLLPGLALAGVPPFSGFWAKVLLVDAALAAEAWWLAALALGVGLLTLYAMARMFSELFWKPRPAAAPALATERPPVPIPALAATLAMVGIVTYIGVQPAPFIAFAQIAGAQLADPSAYIAAVLGGTP